MIKETEQFSPEELARWCQQTLPDDTRAFEALVSKYKQSVFATAYRLVGNRDDAEDAAQDTFLKVYRSIGSLSHQATLTSWIYRITTRTCLDLLEKRNRSETISLGAEETDSSPTYIDSRILTPEEATIRTQLIQCLEKALANLDAEGRCVVVLRDIEDRSYQEIAEFLSLGLSAVKMRIYRSRIALKKLLDRVCPGMAEISLGRGGR